MGRHRTPRPRRHDPAVAVVRRVGDEQLTPYPKALRSRQQGSAHVTRQEALERLPARVDSPLRCPARRGGHINLANWRSREWYRLLEAAGVRKRRPYHLCHSLVTEALAAGMPTFLLSRVMGCSVQMLEGHYGHLAHDSEQAARAVLDARAAT